MMLGTTGSGTFPDSCSPRSSLGVSGSRLLVVLVSVGFYDRRKWGGYLGAYSVMPGERMWRLLWNDAWLQCSWASTLLARTRVIIVRNRVAFIIGVMSRWMSEQVDLLGWRVYIFSKCSRIKGG